MDIVFTYSGATFDATERYRYTLERVWVEHPKRLCNFVMLNPSTADAKVLDPTVTRCVGYAHDWGYDGLIVTNIFAFRSTNPKLLRAVDDPVGPDNNAAILAAAYRSKLVIAAWGTHGKLHGRGGLVAEQLRQVMQNDLKCLGMTKYGHPKHPLYLRQDTRPQPLVLTAA
jgi:hypothetical protein